LKLASVLTKSAYQPNAEFPKAAGVAQKGMVPVRRVERADTPWIWCPWASHLLANRQANQHREDGSEYNISIFPDLGFSFIVFNFSHFSFGELISDLRSDYMVAALGKPP